MIERLATDSAIIVSGHRGYRSAYPENTLLAFQKAMELGVEMIEFDLRFSSDKVIMVIHDETVDRTTNGSGNVNDYRMSELKQLDAGGWFGSAFEGLKIPTLEELCELLRSYPDVLLNVEVKPSADASEVADEAVAMLRRYGYLQRCVFTSFDGEIIARFHDKHRVRTQGFPAEQMHHFVHGDQGTYAKMWAIAFSMDRITPESVKEAKGRGHLVWCYAPNDEQQVRYALQCGATLLTCDDPVPAMRIRP